jgi:Na+-translocating ferredoxin:NAD+ oxidoreductase RnfA subunit
MDNTFVWIIAFAVAVACGLFSAKLAGDKGRSPVGYGLLGFFLPLIGIIVAAVVPRKL